MQLPGKPRSQGLLRRCAVAGTAMLTIFLTAGCHKHARVSRRTSPPPPTSTRTNRGISTTTHGTPATARRVPPPMPRAPVDDNLPASGSVSAAETGMASWYGPPYANHPGANGEIYNSNALTAAHRTLPMGTVVRVTNLDTNQAVTVKITDRGPFVHGRLIDLSIAAAKSTGVYRMGTARVRVEVLEERASATTPGRWCVQVGAFTNPANADHLRTDMLHRYALSAKIVEFQGPTGHWVRINPLAGDRARATQIVAVIHPSEPDAQAYLVRLD